MACSPALQPRQPRPRPSKPQPEPSLSIKQHRAAQSQTAAQVAVALLLRLALHHSQTFSLSLAPKTWTQKRWQEGAPALYGSASVHSSFCLAVPGVVGSAAKTMMFPRPHGLLRFAVSWFKRPGSQLLPHCAPASLDPEAPGHQVALPLSFCVLLSYQN